MLPGGWITHREGTRRPGGIRYIVLDTVSYGGQFPLSSAGNIDHPQFSGFSRNVELLLADPRADAQQSSGVGAPPSSASAR